MANECLGWYNPAPHNMLGNQSPKPAVGFGAFQLDLQTGELHKAGVLLRLAPRPFRLLALLASRPNQLVTRDEIREEVWGNETFVDFDQGMNACVKQIRAALGDDAETPRFIETLPRRGYRFIAPVESIEQGTAIGTIVPAIPISTGSKRRRLPVLYGAILLAALLGTVATIVLQNYWTPETPAPRLVGLVVLPFEDLRPDPAQEYFADGMTDALITNLAKVGELRVISRTSSMKYKNSNRPLAQIARDLNVEAVVEGSILRVGDEVRISVRLVHAPTDRHLWAETYQRDLRDVLAMQGEVTRAIVEHVQLNLTAQEKVRLANFQRLSPGAYEAYLKGRYFWNKRTEQGLRKSLDYFREAIEQDPSYALAYSGLADAYIVLGEFGEAEIAARRALAIDNSLAEAHASLGRALMLNNWDWAGAESEFKQAIELNPSYATAHQGYSHYLTARGRFADAIREARAALELDPLSMIINENLGWQLYLARRYDESIHQLRRTLDLDPAFIPALESLGLVLAQKKRYEDAIRELQAATRLAANRKTTAALLGYVYAVSGRKSKAMKVLKGMDSRSMGRQDDTVVIAMAYSGLGREGLAFEWLEKAYKERTEALTRLNVDPIFDPLRADPRFQHLLRQMNFPE